MKTAFLSNLLSGAKTPLLVSTWGHITPAAYNALRERITDELLRSATRLLVFNDAMKAARGPELQVPPMPDSWGKTEEELLSQTYTIDACPICNGRKYSFDDKCNPCRNNIPFC